MPSLRTATAPWSLTLAVAAAIVTRSFGYTFDPLNNIWKPSGGSGRPSPSSSVPFSSSSPSNGHHHSNHQTGQNNHQYQQQYSSPYYYGGGGSGQYSSSAASYASQPGLADHYDVADGDGASGDTTNTVQVFEENVVRAQYSTWAGQYHNGENGNDGETFRPKSLVQMEYNKKTGEVSLVDQDGIVTAEDYQRLMKIVMMEEGGAGADAASAADDDGRIGDRASGLEYPASDVAVGSTLYVDAEDLDQSKVIDTDAEVLSSETIPLTPEQQQHLQQHAYEQALYAAQAAYEDHDQSYHDQAAYAHHPPSAPEIPPSRDTADSFNSYNIPQPTSASATYQQYQRQDAATETSAAEMEESDSPRGAGFGFNQRRLAFM